MATKPATKQRPMLQEVAMLGLQLMWIGICIIILIACVSYYLGR